MVDPARGETSLPSLKPKETSPTLEALCRQFIKNFKFDNYNSENPGRLKFQRIVLQLFGYIGHGKSSFINTCKSVWDGTEYHNYTNASGSYEEDTMDRQTYQLTENIILADKRGFSAIEDNVKYELYAQIANVLPLNTNFDRSQMSAKDRIWQTKCSVKFTDFIVPILVYSVASTRKPDEIDTLKGLLRNFSEITGIRTNVVLTHETGGDLEDVRTKFRDMETEQIISLENITPQNPSVSEEVKALVIYFLHEVVHQVYWRSYHYSMQYIYKPKFFHKEVKHMQLREGNMEKKKVTKKQKKKKQKRVPTEELEKMNLRDKDEQTEELGKRGRAQFGCTRCGKDEDSAFIVNPIINEMVYRLKLVTAGLFRCSKTGIKFQVTRPVTIEYELQSWRKYSALLQSLDMEYEILGPIFNIITTTDPSVISAVYLPHCLCIKDFGQDTMAIKCAHIKDDNLTLEVPTRVEPYYVVLENPTFSAIGTILHIFRWMKDGITKLLPVHGMVLLYYGIVGINDPDHRKFRFHLYLMPCNISVEMNINNHEEKLGYQKIHIPHQTEYLYNGRNYQIGASDNARVLPKKLLFRCTYVSELYPFTQINVDYKRASEGIAISVDDDDNLVWQAEIDKGDIVDWLPAARSARQGCSFDVPSPDEHFVDKHRSALISAITLVEPILDDLRCRSLLTEEQYTTASCKPTSQERMRELYRYITFWSHEDKDKVYQILRKHNRPVINSL